MQGSTAVAQDPQRLPRYSVRLFPTSTMWSHCARLTVPPENHLTCLTHALVELCSLRHISSSGELRDCHEQLNSLRCSHANMSVADPMCCHSVIRDATVVCMVVYDQHQYDQSQGVVVVVLVAVSVVGSSYCLWSPSRGY